MPEGRSGRKRREAAARRPLIYVLLVGVIAGLIGWINQAYISEQWRWWWTDAALRGGEHLALRAEPRPSARSSPTQKSFRECAAKQGEDYCPEMVMIPAGHS